MESWITWIIQVVAYGIICFLLKRELNQFDQRDKRLQERIDEVEKKASADTKALAEKMDNFIQGPLQIHPARRLHPRRRGLRRQAGQNP